MLDRLLNIGEFLLVVVLAILQVGRWAQKSEDTPEALAKDLSKCRAEHDKSIEEIKREIRNQEFQNAKLFARKDVLDEKFRRIEEGHEALGGRVESLEEWQRKVIGIN